MYYFKLTFSKYVTENCIFCSKVFLVTLSKKPDDYNYWVCDTTCCSHHSHKKRMDTLEAQAELVVLHTYVENQPMLEPILLYRALKCKQTKEQGGEDCLWTQIFTFLYVYCQLFKKFFCKDASKTRSKCAIKACNFSKKRKLTLYKT